AGEGGGVGLIGLRGAAQAVQQVGADRVEQVVAVQVQRVDQGEGRGGAVYLGDGHGAVEGGDRAAVEGRQLAVEGEDLAPVGVRRGGGVGVHRVHRGLDLVRARPG